MSNLVYEHLINSVENQKALKDKSKKTILIYGGALATNGITISLKNFLISLDKKRFSVFLTIDPNSFNKSKQVSQLKELAKYAEIIPRVGRMNLNIEEDWLIGKQLRWQGLPNKEMTRYSNIAYKKEIKHIFGDTHFDIVINYEGFVRFWTLLFAQFSNNSIFLHADMIKEWKERFPNLELNFNLYENYNHLISVSKSVNSLNRNLLANKYHIALSKFNYVRNPLNIENIFQKSIDRSHLIEQEKNILDDPNNIIFSNVSRLSIEKGHEQLIKAFQKIVTMYPNAKLIIIGDGPLYSYLNQLIKDIQLDESIFLLGLKENPYVYIYHSDCFILSSKYEGQGLAMLEAMTLGKPVISTDFLAAHEVLNNGKYGKIVENSEEGLYQGLLYYLQGKIKTSFFNYEEYQNRSLLEIEENILN